MQMAHSAIAGSVAKRAGAISSPHIRQ
jgi:hypothetical protein